MFLFIIILVISFILLGIYLKYLLNKKSLIDAFERNNCIVDGKKGTGKDALFDFIIRKRKKVCFSNIYYGENTFPINAIDMSVAPNTYENFINGEIQLIHKNEGFEGKDIYISDAGIYLPSQYDSLLHKKFPSLPIFYALSRHLYNCNVHLNSQNLDRIWKALREQGETFIHCKRTINLPFFLITTYNIYDKQRSASMCLEPYKTHKHGLIRDRELTDNKKSEFKALYGDIKSGFIIQLKKNISYDTRAFEKLIFENPTSNVKKIREKWSLKKVLQKFKKKKKEEEEETEK